MTTTIKQNVTSGKHAVALVGYSGWRRESAIGDGVTKATMALVTRCGSKTDAARIAKALNDAQPGVLPGSKDVPVYEARKYAKTDYLSQQDRRNGDRDCDRRIVHD